ncbi:long-chain acyl-CoA synthetase [Constrictibacter sp. MBR-5]|jgi:long-chain acyl-CoA synthetase|uniref:acyl-CoA synthetase n=1 Tax=Constrictibacter sp. MBR-5 TaxID=3156467 RepID=UPI0033983762
MQTGIVSGARRLERADLDDAVARAASGFAGLGVGQGDAVAWMLRNDHALFETTLAAGLLGAYPVPVNWHFSAEEVAYVLRDSMAKVLVIHADLHDRVRDGLASLEAPPAVLVVETPAHIASAYRVEPPACAPREGDIAWREWLALQARWSEPPRQAPSSMMYTSGTTGRPKGVRRRPWTAEQRAVYGRINAPVMGFRPGLRTVVTAPLYHAAPNSHALGAAAAENSLVVLQPRFDAEDLLRLIDAHRITNLFMVPVMFVRLLRLPAEVRARFDVSSIEHVVHAGAPCAPDIKRAMIDWWGPVFHEYYGSTESSLITATTTAEWLAKPGSVGRAVENATIRILDDSGRELPAGEIGEIFVRRSDVPDFTYQNDEDKRAGVERDGLITNGDVGYLDADGYLFLCDRRRDMVISGGVNIYPAEIEDVLIRHPGIRDCAVFGIPDAEYGEALAAFVQPVPDGGLTVDEVKRHLREHVAGYKVPRLIELRDELPREDTGKIFKRKLREPFWEAAGRRI